MIKEETKTKAFKYFCLGLNSKEIAKLLDLNYRTVQGIMSREKWKDKTKFQGVESQAMELKEKGLSVTEISKTLNISRVTVYKYMKKARM